MTNKRPSTSLFSTIEQLEIDDLIAAKKRKKVAEKSIVNSKAARAQNNLFTELMEIRILMQKALHTSTSTSTSTSNASEKILDNEKSIHATRKKSASIIRNLVKARKLLGQKGVDDDDDEEEGDGHDHLQSSYEKHTEHWKEVLDKRHREVQLHSGLTVGPSSKKFKVVDQSFWSQVVATTSQDRILERVNKEWKDPAEEDSENQKRRVSVSVSPTQLFQDSKLYQNMLKDFISSSTSSQSRDELRNDDDELKNMISLNNNKKSTKKNVDRRASKGRKIRYVSYPKLVNYTFPIQRRAPLISEDDWFKSLFGGANINRTKDN